MLLFAWFVAVTALACASTPHPADEAAITAARERMVREQIESRGVRDRPTLAALRRVHRHLFVPAELVAQAYEDHPLPIGHGQTISQPYIVAFMTEAARVSPASRVLEVGTGSGYQAAVLAVLAKEVYSIEIVEPLGTEAARRLSALGHGNVKVRVGDGYAGWPSEAPFDAVVVTAGAPHVPPPLFEQLAPGGRLVIPVDAPEGGYQVLWRITKGTLGEWREERLLDVRFVPLTGEAERDRRTR